MAAASRLQCKVLTRNASGVASAGGGRRVGTRLGAAPTLMTGEADPGQPHDNFISDWWLNKSRTHFGALRREALHDNGCLDRSW